MTKMDDIKQALQDDGVSEAVIDEVAAIAPLDEWHFCWPNEDRTQVETLVACPKCGSEANYALDAVTDFHCPDDEECGYDYPVDSEGLKPVPA